MLKQKTNDDTLSLPSSSRDSSAKLPKLILQTFSGDPAKYQEFWDSYNSAVHSNLSLDVSKFNYLKFGASLDVGKLRRSYSNTENEVWEQTAVHLISSQFNYSPLVWMLHSRTLNNRINRIQERSLRIVYNDQISSFGTLLEKDNSTKVHHKNLQVLATEMYKIQQNIGPVIMKDILPLNIPYYIISEITMNFNVTT